jgi:hypothetical protein
MSTKPANELVLSASQTAAIVQSLQAIERHLATLAECAEAARTLNARQAERPVR